MVLKEKIHAEMITAMKSKEKNKLTIIRMLMADIKNEEIKIGKELGDQEIAAIVQKLQKQMKETLEGYEKQGTNTEKIQETKYQIEVLAEYLPKQLSEDEVREIVKTIIETNGFEGKKDMGKLMKEVMPKVKGQADGSLVKKIVSELL